MRFKLIHKQSNEVVDTVDVIKTSEQIATELFRQRKQLDDKTGKSEKMKTIVREIVKKHGFEEDNFWNDNPGAIVLRS